VTGHIGEFGGAPTETVHEPPPGESVLVVVVMRVSELLGSGAATLEACRICIEGRTGAMAVTERGGDTLPGLNLVRVVRRGTLWSGQIFTGDLSLAEVASIVGLPGELPLTEAADVRDRLREEPPGCLAPAHRLDTVRVRLTQDRPVNSDVLDVPDRSICGSAGGGGVRPRGP